jgi:hypothetical protein
VSHFWALHLVEFLGKKTTRAEAGAGETLESQYEFTNTSLKLLNFEGCQ